MNLRASPCLVFLTGALAPLASVQAADAVQPPVPVLTAPANSDRSLLTPPAGENQRLYGPARATLITPEAAQELTGKFRAAYGAENAPRLVVYVNRALIDTESGLKVTGRTEKFYESTTTKSGAEPSKTTDTSGENTYTAQETPKLTLADRQTVREVERLFGRVFRHAGAKLADPVAAATLLDDKPGVLLGASQSGRERDALKQVADIAIEVLISSRSLTISGVAGEATYSVPDIQVTAIRLSDSAIVGQASASDVLGGGAAASGIARQFGVADITEATAFALMEDMLTGR